ncbi:MAG: sulfatase-like hydrolase/transferase [Bacteroidia bacterium]|nr:sulfatase-like hydrolase/transferase [Bacteroidia bacterium]
MASKKNTLIFFLSDNGGPERVNASDNGILRGGKSDLFEGGVRVPFAMRWPGRLPAGQKYEKPVISLDIFATVVAQVQQPISTGNLLDLMPFLTTERSDSPHPYLFWRKFDTQQYAARNETGDKILSSREQIRLFNLAANIREDNSLTKPDSLRSHDLNRSYQEWRSHMLDPVFLGLNEDEEYSNLHPNRFQRPD